MGSDLYVVLKLSESRISNILKNERKTNIYIYIYIYLGLLG